LSCVLEAAGLGDADELGAPLTLAPLTDGAAAEDMESVGGEGAAGQGGEETLPLRRMREAQNGQWTDEGGDEGW
jgi:hypothetical protein